MCESFFATLECELLERRRRRVNTVNTVNEGVDKR
jgi:hypothetical protein